MTTLTQTESNMISQVFTDAFKAAFLYTSIDHQQTDASGTFILNDLTFTPGIWERHTMIDANTSPGEALQGIPNSLGHTAGVMLNEIVEQALAANPGSTVADLLMITGELPELYTRNGQLLATGFPGAWLLIKDYALVAYLHVDVFLKPVATVQE